MTTRSSRDSDYESAVDSRQNSQNFQSTKRVTATLAPRVMPADIHPDDELDATVQRADLDELVRLIDRRTELETGTVS